MSIIKSSQAQSQNPDSAQFFKLEFADDYRQIEPQVLDYCNVLLHTPIDDVEWPKLRDSFVYEWIEGTPDYFFVVDQHVETLMECNSKMLDVYLAAACRFAIENPEKAQDPEFIRYHAMVVSILYVEMPENKVGKCSNLKYMLEAKEKDNLMDYLDIKLQEKALDLQTD